MKTKSIEKEFKSKFTDTELLHYLELEGLNLVNDDNGRWCVTGDGMQNIRDKSSGDIQTTFFIEKEEWKNSIREAISTYIEENGLVDEKEEQK